MAHLNPVLINDEVFCYYSGIRFTAFFYNKSLQSTNIASIVLMPDPSAKYDAAGGGGIINIPLKKLKASGYNGDVSAGFHYGASPKTEQPLR